jgi:hypothetical protein
VENPTNLRLKLAHPTIVTLFADYPGPESGGDEVPRIQISLPIKVPANLHGKSTFFIWGDSTE